MSNLNFAKWSPDPSGALVCLFGFFFFCKIQTTGRNSCRSAPIFSIIIGIWSENNPIDFGDDPYNRLDTGNI